VSGGLDGLAVVVAGASGGIGAACARSCADAGARSVALLARDAAALDAIADDVAARGATPLVRRCDVTSAAAIDAAFAGLGPVDVLVNGAGANRPTPFPDVTPDAFDALVALNLRGAFFLAQAAVRAIRAGRRGGAVVTVSSQMGHVGAPGRTVYCATKHAVEGLTKALAVELAPEGIRAVTVAPTFVRTGMTAAQLDDPVVGRALLAQIPAGRWATAEEVAAAVVFAASPAAASLTGTSLVLDGGWTAR
jgi:NAD(P)-dependent dehydrogenase (short-subunit alcohol dehydrogenase family)